MRGRLRDASNGSRISRNELFRAALAVILRARERLRDVDGGQAHLEKILRHMEDLHELNWDLLGQDYDGYDGDGPSGGISEGMIAAGLGELRHPCILGDPQQLGPKSEVATSPLPSLGAGGWEGGRGGGSGRGSGEGGSPGGGGGVGHLRTVGYAAQV